MLESCSAEARRAVSLAIGEARRLHHRQVGTEHLLLGLLGGRGTRAANALGAAGVRLTGARQKVAEANPEADHTAGGGPADELPYSPRARRALDRAARFARQAGAGDTGTSHLLLGVLDVEGLACQVLRGLGVDPDRLRDDLHARRVEETPVPDDAAPGIVVPPCCPACAAPLDGALAVTPVVARDAGSSDGTTVRVVHCASCGTALGVLPTRG